MVVNCLSADTQKEGYGRYPGIAFLGADSSGIAANCGVRGISLAGTGPYALRNCVIRKNGNSSRSARRIYCETFPRSLPPITICPAHIRYGVNFDPSATAARRGGFVPLPRGVAGAGYDRTPPPRSRAPTQTRRRSISGPGPDRRYPTRDERPNAGGRFRGLPRGSDPPGAGAGSRPYHDIGAVECREDGPCAAPLRLLADGTLFPRGAGLRLAAAVQPTSRRFDAYAVLAGPAGTYSILPGGRLAPGIRRYLGAVRGIEAETKAALLEIEVPANIPAGAWTLHAGLVPPQAPPRSSTPSRWTRAAGGARLAGRARSGREGVFRLPPRGDGAVRPERTARRPQRIAASASCISPRPFFTNTSSWIPPDFWTAFPYICRARRRHQAAFPLSSRRA